jgi:hypothetical protein
MNKINNVIPTFRDSQFAKFDRGELMLPFFLRRAKVKILIVMDNSGGFLSGSFNTAYFGLSKVLDTLRDEADYYVEFDVKRAHRSIDPFKPPVGDAIATAKYAPHYENFRFAGAGKPADFNLDDYDQVWFFGLATSGTGLDNTELDLVARWMDEKKGGVFAVGDHAEIGKALCSNIPRVRKMRKWTAAQGVPSSSGTNRHDTLIKGHNNKYTFDDESDDIPMNIDVRYYPIRSFSPFFSRSQPHPLLCGKHGVIKVFPDHPHEGEVIEEAAVDTMQNVSFTTYLNKPEFPTHNGHKETPDVIAHSFVQGDHTEGRGGATGTDQNKGPANAKRFPIVGAYDGHKSNIGRVAVDSTWHHWFDVNLVGRHYSDDPFYTDAVDASKHVGFSFSTSGAQHFEQIKCYYKNMALWLNNPAKIAQLYFRACWGHVVRYPAVERFTLDVAIWELGESALDAIGRRVGKCTVKQWIHDIFELPERKMILKEPCLGCPPPEFFEIMVLGGTIREMLAYFYEQEKINEKIDEKKLLKYANTGLQKGMDEAISLIERSYANNKELVPSLKKDMKIKLKLEL